MAHTRWACWQSFRASVAIAALIGAIWSLVTGVFAVREALDTTTGNAVITVVIGWAVLFVVGLIVTGILGVGAIRTRSIVWIAAVVSTPFVDPLSGARTPASRHWSRLVPLCVFVVL